MTLNEALSIRLCELLEEKHMTTYRLYTRSGVSQATISDIKNKKYVGTNLRIIFELCEGLGVGISEFFDSPLFAPGSIMD